MIYFNGGLVAYACQYHQEELWEFGMMVISLGQQHRLNMKELGQNHDQERPTT